MPGLDSEPVSSLDCGEDHLLVDQRRVNRPVGGLQHEVGQQVVQGRLHLHLGEAHANAVPRTLAESQVAVGIDVAAVFLAEAVRIELVGVLPVSRVHVEARDRDLRGRGHDHVKAATSGKSNLYLSLGSFWKRHSIRQSVILDAESLNG